MMDVTWKGLTERKGVELWFIGTDTAKDWIYNRYAFEDGPGSLHFANDLPDEFFAQCVAERKVARYVKGYKRIEWVKGKADPWGMVINPAYKRQSYPRSDFPRTDNTCITYSDRNVPVCTFDLFPFAGDLYAAARAASRGDSFQHFNYT